MFKVTYNGGFERICDYVSVYQHSVVMSYGIIAESVSRSKVTKIEKMVKDLTIEESYNMGFRIIYDDDKDRYYVIKKGTFIKSYFDEDYIDVTKSYLSDIS